MSVVGEMVDVVVADAVDEAVVVHDAGDVEGADVQGFQGYEVPVVTANDLALAGAGAAGALQVSMNRRF